MLSDEEIRDYILNPANFNKSMFIEAGAGAGKSTIIVERIVAQLRQNRDPSRIVAITFTNKAAEELRSRLISALFDTVKSEKDINTKNNLEYALNNINRMNISTIHSFCKTLLKQRCIEANLPFSFTLIEDEDVVRREDICFRDWSNTHLTDSDHYKLSSFGDPVKVYMDSIKSIYKILANQIEPIPREKIYTKEIDDSITKKYKDVLVDIYTTIKDNVTSDKDLVKGARTFFDEYERIVIKQQLHEPDTKDLYKLFSLISDGKVFSSKGDLKDINDQISEALNGLSKEDCKIVSNNEKFLLYVDFAYSAYQFYLDYLSVNRDEISNNQLIYETYRLLDNKNVRNCYSKKYPIIYIDEYQDTDHFQWEIAKKLTMDDEGNFIPGSTLFLVGDPKQSIYRFRGAEPSVYFETKKVFSDIELKGGNAVCLFLDKNFRSHKDVIGWVNDTYSSTKDNPIKLTSEDYKPMTNDEENTLKDSDEKSLHGVYYYDDDSAEGLANLINTLVNKNNNYKASNKIKEEGHKHHYEWNNINFKDILVITPKAEGMDPYLQVLADNNIPYTVDGVLYSFNDKAVRIFINLLSNLLDINNTRSYIGSIEALRATLFDYSTNYDEDTNKLACLVEKLRNDIKGLSSYSKVEYLINHPEYYLDKEIEYKDFEINHIKAKLYSLMESCFASGDKNDLDIVEYFAKQLDGKIEHELSLENSPDAVRVMNMHKSKGLQGKIVIFAKRDLKTTFSYETAYKDGYLYLGLLDSFMHLNWCSYYFDKEILDSIKSDHDLEVARIEYVVATRAEQALIFTSSKKEESHFSRSSINYSLEKLRSIKICENSEDLHKNSCKNNLNCENYKLVNLDLYDEKLGHEVYKITTPSEIENEVSVLRQLYLEKAQKDNEMIFDPNRPGNNIVGNCLHRAFELYHNNLKISDKENLIDICVTQSLHENDIPESLYESYSRFVSSCLLSASSWLKNIIQSGNSEAENKFYYFDKETNIWWNGSIDLSVRNNDTLEIYDYKSDEAIYIHDDNEFEKTLIEKYSPQLQAYKKAMSFIYPEIKNITLTIVYFRNYNKDTKQVSLKLLKIN